MLLCEQETDANANRDDVGVLHDPVSKVYMYIKPDYQLVSNDQDQSPIFQ